MSNKKKSFLLHIDSLDILDDLTNGQAGVLFKAIKAYQHNEDFPLDSVVKIAFSPFKNQFFRDDEKYVITCEKRALAGSKGGKQKVANASNSKQELANVADTKNKTKNKNKNDKEVTVDNALFMFDEFWDMYGKKRGRPKCETLWKKLSGVDVGLIFDNLPSYILSEPDKQYRKDPERWLKNECWNDEVINDERFNGNNKGTVKKLSAYERVKQRNDAMYRQPNERELVVGTDGGDLGRTVDQGAGGKTIEFVDNQSFIDYEQSS